MSQFWFVRRSGSRKREDGTADVVCERDQDGVVVLEEGAGCVFKKHVTDMFMDGGVMVCYTYVGFRVVGHQ